MKFHSPISASASHLLDVWAKICFIAAAAYFVALIPIILTSEIAQSSANNTALYGEAGLWGEFGHKD